MDAGRQILGKLLFQIVEQRLLVFFLFFNQLLLRNILGLFDLYLGGILLLKVDIRMLLVVVLSEVVLTLKEFGTVVTLHSSVAWFSVFWDFYQVLVGCQSLLLHLVLFSQVADLGVILLDLVSDALGGLECVFVLQVERAGEAFEVVLSVNEVLDAHLRQPEQLDECLVTKPFHVLAVQVCISDILKKPFKLPKIHLLSDLIDISIHDLPPVEPSGPLLKREFWRHGSVESQAS